MRKFDLMTLFAAARAVLSALLLTTLCAATTARAAPPMPMTWTGFYIGGNGGYGWGHRNIDFSPNDPASAIGFATAFYEPPPISFDMSGGLGGLQAGYNWQFSPRWLVGVEADFDWADMKGSGSSTGLAAGVAPFTATVDEKIKWFGTVRGRLGFLPTPDLLAFVTGGLAYGKVERQGIYVNNAVGVAFVAVLDGFSFSCLPSGATCFSGSTNEMATGWTLGGGLEYALWGNVTLKAEYLYVSLESKSVVETALVLDTPGTKHSSITANYSRTTFNVARAGVNIRF
jgi:outer membrane immunogenic protein